jgi:protein SCO1/2
MLTKRLIWGIFIAVLLGISAAFARKVWQAPAGPPNTWRGSPLWGGPATPLPVLGTVKPFALIDQHHQLVDLKTLEGSPWVADFIFTSCRGQCPLLSQRMERLQALIPPEEPVHLISISVDPEHDTPAILEAYARRYHAHPERWKFLTGEPAAIRRLIQDSFKVGANEETIRHSSHLVLVDGHAQIRGYYDGLDEQEIQRLVQDLSRLSAQAGL